MIAAWTFMVNRIIEVDAGARCMHHAGRRTRRRSPAHHRLAAGVTPRCALNADRLRDEPAEVASRSSRPGTVDPVLAADQDDRESLATAAAVTAERELHARRGGVAVIV
jgi:hypothetical protein